MVFEYDNAIFLVSVGVLSRTGMVFEYDNIGHSNSSKDCAKEKV